MKKNKGVKSKKTSQQLTRETRKRLREMGHRNRKFVHLTCIKCKKIWDIRINAGDEVLFTDKLKKNYICLLCRVR